MSDERDVPPRYVSDHKTIDELMAEQGITGPQDLSDLSLPVDVAMRVADLFSGPTPFSWSIDHETVAALCDGMAAARQLMYAVRASDGACPCGEHASDKAHVNEWRARWRDARDRLDAALDAGGKKKEERK